MKLNKSEKLRTIKPNFIKLDIFSVSDIKRKHNGHWFSKDTMRFFNSRVGETVYCGSQNAYFVSSEQFIGSSGKASPRKFTVRKYNAKTGDISTVGEFNEIDSKAVANTIALNLAYEETIKEAV